MKLHKPVVLSMFFMCVKLGLTLEKEHRWRVFEKIVLRRIFWSKMEEVQKDGGNGIMRSFITCVLHHILLG
jgi:hypothetical protein